MQQVSIDVMVPFYGDVSHLLVAVKSVLGQTSPSWNLTIVDDGFPDKSIREKISLLNDPRITYIRNEVNLGANSNYRKCVSLSTSELVVLMGADDVMMPNYIELMLTAYAQNPRASIYHPRVTVIDESGNQYSPYVDKLKKFLAPRNESPQYLSGEALASSLMKGNWTYFPSICWRRDQLLRHQFRSGLNVTQDLALLIDQTMDGAELVYLPTVAFKYRRHKSSDSSIRALDGSRFHEESELFNVLSKELSALGWNKAATHAKLHLFSRANALTNVPRVIKNGHWKSFKKLSRHIFFP
jgi:glycosyltransferase involved in cell wall biosynthesis